MYEGLLKYAIPTLIVISFVNFIWAWILTAVKSPTRVVEENLPGGIGQDWKYMDTGPEGVKLTIPQKVKPKIKTT
jgi:hypothetical protein